MRIPPRFGSSVTLLQQIYPLGTRGMRFIGPSFRIIGLERPLTASDRVVSGQGCRAHRGGSHGASGMDCRCRVLEKSSELELGLESD